MTGRRRHLAVPLVLAALAGCAGRTPPPVPVPSSDPCLIPAAAGATPLDTVRVGVDGPVRIDSLATPVTSAERLVARQLYAGLVRLDCEGGVRPDLAVRWTRDPRGPSWLLDLRPDARFDDGMVIDATAVRDAWLAREPVRGWLAAGRLAVEVVGPRSLRVTLPPGEGDSTPAPLADRRLAIRGAPGADGVAAASGAYRRPAAAAASGVVLVPRGWGPILRIVELPPGLDGRDVLDREAPRVDLLVTRDPETADYARDRGDLSVVPLAWDRTYALVEPAGGDAVPTPAERTALARDAVRAVARAAVPPYWWERDPACRRDSVSIPVGGLPEGILYRTRDPVARALAERVVALAGQTTAPAWLSWPAAPLRVAGGDERALAGARSRLGAVAIVDLPRVPAPACLGAGLAPGLRLVPLIETRAHVVTRRGVPSLDLDGAGLFLVQPR